MSKELLTRNLNNDSHYAIKSVDFKTIQVPTHPEIWLNGTLYYKAELSNSLTDVTNDPPKMPLLVYLHGGGLVFGSRKDLPQFHIQTFLSMGYQVLCLDYPLAPEANLALILTTIQAYISWLSNHPESVLPFERYDVFGRSAGAYLAFKWAEFCIKENHLMAPRNLIAFYGYPTFNHDAFKSAQKEKQHLYIDKDAAVSVLSDKIIIDDPLFNRGLYYFYLRQEGLWAATVTGGQVTNYDLDLSVIAKFPKTFMTASIDDTDVPFSLGKRLSRQLPHSVFHQVYGMPHDFDREVDHPEVIQIFDLLGIWLSE